jgi:hypothetical protein
MYTYIYTYIYIYIYIYIYTYQWDMKNDSIFYIYVYIYIHICLFIFSFICIFIGKHRNFFVDFGHTRENERQRQVFARSLMEVIFPSLSIITPLLHPYCTLIQSSNPLSSIP